MTWTQLRLSAMTERLAIGLTLAMRLLLPSLLVLRQKARMYVVLDRAYPELALRLLSREAVKHRARPSRMACTAARVTLV